MSGPFWHSEALLSVAIGPRCYSSTCLGDQGRPTGQNTCSEPAAQVAWKYSTGALGTPASSAVGLSQIPN